VINFDPPEDSETYVHRTGRTGRAGRAGIGITLLSPEQRRDVTKLAGQLGLEHGLHDTGRRGAGTDLPHVDTGPSAPWSRPRPRRRRPAGRQRSQRPSRAA
jgi:ATP-dependent RNA helicase RhlE